MRQKTKIVATVGPASTSEPVLRALMRAGLSVARLNFSHGDFSEHERRVSLIRAAAKKEGKKVAILQDLGGPKIRTGDLMDDSVVLKKGASLILTTQKVRGDATRMSVSYKNLPHDVRPGHRILLNDGKQELVVRRVRGTEIETVVRVGGRIASRRGINLPDSTLSLSSFTTKDKRDVQFGITHGLDFIALSFVQSARDIRALRRTLQRSGSTAKIIAKIETNSALQNLDEIIAAADGIMVARGDLAVEVGAERVPMLQKDMVKRANNVGKIAIVATQMLESMIDAPVPTRAEVSDVANAILDGADAVMLSAETAVGNYPREVVETMARIARDTEEHMDYTKRLNKAFASAPTNDISEVTARHAAKVAHELSADAVVAFTETGTTAQAVSKFRIAQPIFVISPRSETLAQTALVFGVSALAPVSLSKEDDVIAVTRTLLKKHRVLRKGARVVIVSGSIFGKPGETNTITSIII